MVRDCRLPGVNSVSQLLTLSYSNDQHSKMAPGSSSGMVAGGVCNQLLPDWL